jgi:NAD(P)-dependent dehydrogenase (short-subunit alcohol dehydrogenase family)
MANLEGRRALITGGAVRIGRAIALALARHGCDVFIHFATSGDAAHAVCAEARSLGVRAACGRADLAAAQQARELVPTAARALGHIDILVNSAAVFLEGDATETTLEAWDGQFALNLRAPFLLSQAFAQCLPPDTAGDIVNIVDARIRRPATDHFAYRLTKSALADMTELLALTLAPRIRVNALALGAMLPPPGRDEGYVERLASSSIPLGRAGGPAMVGENVLHLLRQDFITGVVLPIDGGEFL